MPVKDEPSIKINCQVSKTVSKKSNKFTLTLKGTFTGFDLDKERYQIAPGTYQAIKKKHPWADGEVFQIKLNRQTLYLSILYLNSREAEYSATELT